MQNSRCVFLSDENVIAARMRSALLFNNKKNKTGGTRTDMVRKAIFALIIEKDRSIEAITNIFKTNFSGAIDSNTVIGYLKDLYKSGLIQFSGKGDWNDNSTVLVCQKDDNFFRNLEAGTEKLINGIIEKARISIQNETFPNHDVVFETVREALSVYFNMFGYSYVNVQSKDQTSKKNDAVRTVLEKFNKNIGDALVTAIADTLENPDSNDSEVLEQWARAFVTSQVIGIDPMLNNFKQTKLNEKTFVLDTDVILNCMVKNAKYSSQYKEMFASLKKIGCNVIIPVELIDEVSDHIDAARKQYNFKGNQIKELLDEDLESEQSNVFIEDYVKTIRKEHDKSDMTFRSYIDNFYTPDSSVYSKKYMENVFGKDTLNKTINVHIDQNELEELADKNFQHTQLSYKGGFRDEDKNKRLSHVDASLFLKIYKLNQKTDDIDILSKKIYLVTNTTKVIKCAKELGYTDTNVVCSPAALMSILHEIGYVNTNQIRMVNLFENPFLVYTSQRIWTDVEPLLKKGYELKYKDYQRLKYDFDVNFDKILSDDFDIVKQGAEEVSGKGYVFAKEISDSAKEIEKLQKEKEELQKKNSALEKKIGTLKYQQRIQRKSNKPKSH